MDLHTLYSMVSFRMTFNGLFGDFVKYSMTRSDEASRRCTMVQLIQDGIQDTMVRTTVPYTTSYQTVIVTVAIQLVSLSSFWTLSYNMTLKSMLRVTQSR